jgi:acetate kinase
MSLGRAVIAHLANGASMAAVHNGQPVDTAMGFTPTGGFMMGTRSGDLDPGLLNYPLNEQNYYADTLGQLLNDQSGLLGVSGISPDMKTLLDRREHDVHAAQAIDMFCYQLRKTIGALAAALDGLDTLVFTGGIGEHAAPIAGMFAAGWRISASSSIPSRTTVMPPSLALRRVAAWCGWCPPTKT